MGLVNGFGWLDYSTSGSTNVTIWPTPNTAPLGMPLAGPAPMPETPLEWLRRRVAEMTELAIA